MPYYVYILQLDANGSYYIGQTKDLYARFERHNKGMEPFSRKHRPWSLLWHCQKASRADAVKLERTLKNLNRDRLGEFLRKYSI